MSTFNGITVRISDGVKTADYAPPKLYDLTANLTPGVNPEADALAAVQLLQRIGDAYLGRASAPVAAAEIPASPVKAKPKGKDAIIIEQLPSVLQEPEVVQHILQNKSISLPGELVRPVDAASITSASATPASSNSAAAIPGQAPLSQPSATLVTAEDLSDLVSVTEISDASLNTAVTRRLKELGATGPNLVRALKDSYNPEPDKRVLQIRELTQPQRATFLARLEKLSPAMLPEEAARVEA